MNNENKIKELYEDFVERLLSGDYTLYENDKKYTELLFNSHESFPELTNISHYVFKINYLADIVSNEFAKININVSHNEIIESILREKVIIYHKKKMDPLINQDVDYFFVLDSEIFIALGYKRLAIPLDRVFVKVKAEKRFIDPLSIDVDDLIAKMFKLLSFDKTDKQKFIDGEKLISLFRDKQMNLIINALDEKDIAYDNETIEFYVPEDEPRFVEIRFNTHENTIIDSLINFVIKDQKKEYYSLKGPIHSQRTLKVGSLYRFDIKIEMKNFKALNNFRALLFFIQNIKEDK